MMCNPTLPAANPQQDAETKFAGTALGRPAAVQVTLDLRLLFLAFVFQY
jgi:hypothetical protein